jgi:hypothetical protein
VADGSFNGIVCTQTLYLVFDLGRAIGEFNRVLKKDGRVLSTSPFVSPATNEPGHFWNVNQFALRKLYEDHGFKILVLKPTCAVRETIVNLKHRFPIDNLQLYNHWYRRLFSYWFIIETKLARYRDLRDGQTLVQSRFAVDFIVVAEKL